MQTYDSCQIHWLSGIYGSYDDILLHTLPTVFHFSEQAPLSISYSSLLFKPSCIPSYFSSFLNRIKNQSSTHSHHLPKGLTLFLRLLTLINSSTIVLNMILKKYTKPQRHIILIYSSSLRLETSLTTPRQSPCFVGTILKPS